MKAFKFFTFCALLLLLMSCVGLALAEPPPTNFDVGTASVSLGGGPFIYQGTSITPSVSLTFGGTHTADAAGYSVSYSNNINAGWGRVHITGNGAVINDPVLGDVIYTGTIEKSFTIAKAKVTVNFPPSDPGLVYNGQTQGINWSVSGEITPGDAQAYITYSGTPMLANRYLATVSLNSWNYEFDGISSYPFEIRRKPVTVNFPEGSYTHVMYDGTVQTLPWSISGEVTPGDASAQITYYANSGTSLPPKDAGSYTATVSVDGWKYEISGDYYHALIIGSRQLTVVFSSEQSFTYNAQTQMPEWHFDGIADGETPVAQLTLTGTSPEPVNTGVYTMTVSMTGADVNKNYVIIGERNQTFFINRAPVTFTFPSSDPEYVYNAQPQTIPWSVSDPVAGEDPVVGVHYYMDGTGGTPTVSAGNHTAVAYLDFSNPINNNYEITGPFFFRYSISQAPVTITFPSSDPGYTYNGQVQTIPWSVHDPVEGEDPNYQMYYYQYGMMAEPRNAGPYMLHFYMPYDSVNVNYQLMSEDQFDFFIHQKTLTVTPVAKEKLLGTSGSVPVFEYTVSGQVGSDVPIFDGELYCDWEEAPGEYAISQGTLRLIYYEPVNVNYSPQFQFTQGVSFSVRELEGAPDAFITPAVPNGKNGWYDTTAVITPPQGYAIGLVQQVEYAWPTYLDLADGIYGPQTYYLRRISDGAITSAKLLPAFNQDQYSPTISSAMARAGKDGAPGLQITAKDNVRLEKIVVFDGGKPIHTQSLLGMELDEYILLYRLVKPGSYNAAAYDAAGHVSSQTAVVTVSDADGDGLSDVWEAWQGTDPNSRDSDGDGIDDYTVYLLGVTPGGRLPAAAALLLDAQGQGDVGDGLSESFLNSGLVSDLQDMRTEDVSLAPKLDGSAVILQLDVKSGSGWALYGGRLVHFVQGPDGFVCDEIFMLQGSFGALRHVILSSADGSVMLLAHYNETAGRAEGSLSILDTKAKKMAVLSGSDGATAFDLSRDGSRAAYTVGGRTRVVYLQSDLSQDLNVDASVTMFTPDGRLALGTQGTEVLFLQEDGSVAPEAYEGFVDAAQRTNTLRRVSPPRSYGDAAVDVHGLLTFQDDGKGIVYVGGNGTTVVLKAGEV